MYRNTHAQSTCTHTRTPHNITPRIKMMMIHLVTMMPRQRPPELPQPPSLPCQRQGGGGGRGRQQRQQQRSVMMPSFRLPQVVVVVLMLLLVLPQLAMALSRGAPVCTANQSAPGSVHRTVGYTELALVPTNGVTITINGQELGVVPAAGTTTTRTTGKNNSINLITGVPHIVTIARNDGLSFRGVMARLSGGDANVDTTTVVSLVDDENNENENDNQDLLKISNACLVFSVCIILCVRSFVHSLADD